jgi:hypothetical protein
MIKEKRGQGDVIVTVLLILIAIGAVVGVGYFIINAVKSNTASAQAKLDCAKVQFEITNAIDKYRNVTILRLDDGTIKITKLVVTQNRTEWADIIKQAQGIPEPGESKIISTIPGRNNLTLNQEVRLNAYLDNGVTCLDVALPVKVTAA